MNERAYMVLSVSEIRKLLKQATAGAHAAGRVGRKVGVHCIVLTNLEILSDRARTEDGELQISKCEVKILGGAK